MHLNLPSVAKDIAGGGRRSCLPLPGATTSSEGEERERDRGSDGGRKRDKELLALYDNLAITRSAA